MPLNNFGGAGLRRHHADQALTNSVNTVWAEVGEKLGKATMGKYMERFGFYAQPADRPARATSACASGEYCERAGCSTPSGAGRRRRAWPSARTSCSVTPLQMAMVAAAVANGGELMKPAHRRPRRRPRRAHVERSPAGRARCRR